MSEDHTEHKLSPGFQKLFEEMAEGHNFATRKKMAMNDPQETIEIEQAYLEGRAEQHEIDKARIATLEAALQKNMLMVDGAVYDSRDVKNLLAESDPPPRKRASNE